MKHNIRCKYCGKFLTSLRFERAICMCDQCLLDINNGKKKQKWASSVQYS